MGTFRMQWPRCCITVCQRRLEMSRDMRNLGLLFFHNLPQNDFASKLFLNPKTELSTVSNEQCFHFLGVLGGSVNP